MDPPQLPRPDRHGADLPGPGKGGRGAGGPHLGDLPRHADRAGRAGRGLLHGPRRGTSAIRAAHRAAHDRNREPRGIDHREVVSGAPPGVVPVHALPRNLRDHGGVRRLVLARRRAQAGLDRGRQRRGPIRRA